ncbi:deoxyribose-phosphate aldolase [Marininema halotolerans]|uniref:Deoxyribose-phosphate aldolase n=2 Tax=Marininema halotolerans TaxID=1155944 RepID=A0A1I6SZQ2_9BACL|nr:deoxyribose-phosphate aldolase [Marininema halotolerans]
MQEISAGGVVYRQPKGELEILLIEDRYSRWTLPKGKKEAGETDEETALREILEETGVRGSIRHRLETIRYRYFHPQHGDIAKEVHYFLVEANDGEVTPQLSEITGAAWMSPEAAWQKQSKEGYDNNDSVLAQAYIELGLQEIVKGDHGNMNGQELASMIDHTLLKPEATSDQIDRLCDEAGEHHFASVCVNPSWVARAAEKLKGTGVKVCTVVGFPLGATTSETKAFETKEAIKNGAREIDMVMNIGALKSGDLDLVREDITTVVKAADGVLVKVILEIGLLNADEIRVASEKAKAAGAHFVKTSTGFGYGGATEEAVRLMRKTVGEEMGVKASGGVRDLAGAEKMVQAGANRIGASSSVAIVSGKQGSEGY